MFSCISFRLWCNCFNIIYFHQEHILQNHNQPYFIWESGDINMDQNKKIIMQVNYSVQTYSMLCTPMLRLTKLCFHIFIIQQIDQLVVMLYKLNFGRIFTRLIWLTLFTTCYIKYTCHRSHMKKSKMFHKILHS